MVRHFKKIAARVIGIGIHAIKTLFQMPSGCCRYNPSCSEFAKEAIECLPIHRAIAVIVTRIVRCHPFSKGGFDPVPR